jgi:hypothetical protein
MVKLTLQQIKSDFDGFRHLIDIYAQVNKLLFETVEIDMSGATWFDANMCAPFGAILYKISRNLNTVKLINLTPSVKKILSKNGFLMNYGVAKELDTYKTTIEYKRFEPKDERYFATYIEQHLVRKGMPKMSIGLQKKFRESIYEILSNAVLHSETKLGIFACGQFFPAGKRLDFSIADLGIGMKENINKKRHLNLMPEEAIVWATEKYNTTKTGNIPGGLGLKLLRSFISLNKGRIQIVSDAGYWEFANGTFSTKKFDKPFPGTAVNMEINTADKQSYRLSSEADSDNIF